MNTDFLSVNVVVRFLNDICIFVAAPCNIYRGFETSRGGIGVICEVKKAPFGLYLGLYRAPGGGF